MDTEKLLVIITAEAKKLKSELEKAKKYVESFEDKSRESLEKVDSQFDESTDATKVQKNMDKATAAVEDFSTKSRAAIQKVDSAMDSIDGGKISASMSVAQDSVNGLAENANNSLDSVNNSFLAIGSKGALAFAAVATAAVAAFGQISSSLSGLEAESRDYRKEIYRTITSFQMIGGTVEDAQDALATIYSFTGDIGTSSETAAHLSRLSTDMQDLTEHAITLRGIYAMFPNNSVDVAGMTDSIAETIELGIVTGTLADALNWVGINEDIFNEKLAETNSKAERSALVWDTLNGAYYEAGMLYQQNAAGLNALQWEEMKLMHTKALLGDKLAYTQAAFTHLANTLLQALAPAIIIIGKLLEQLANFLSMVISKISSAINNLFGINGNAFWDDFVNRFGGVNTEASTFNSSLNGAVGATSKLGGGIKAAAKGAKNLAKGFKDATNEANKLNRTTEAFDELIKAKAKKTTTPETDTGGTGGTGTGGTGIGGDLGNIGSGNVDIEVGVTGEDKVQEILTKIGKKVKELYDEYIKPFVDDIKAIGKMMNDALEPYLDDVLGGFKKLATGIGKVLGGIIKIVQGAFRIITGIITGDTDKVYDGFDKIAEGFGQINEGANDMAGGVGDLAKAALEMKSASDGTILGNIGKTAKNLWEDISKAFEESAIGKFFLGAKDTVFEIAASVTELPGSALEKIKGAWEVIKDKKATLEATFEEIKGTIGDKIKGAWETIKDKGATLIGKFTDNNPGTRGVLSKAWDTIKKKSATLKGYFSNKNPGTRKTLVKAWDKLKTKSSTLTAKFRDFFSGALRRAWNGIARGINGGISIINRIPGVNIGKVPYLATGGITTGSTLAHIGEGGYQEAVLPLERNTEWMNTLADKIAERGGAGGARTIVLEVDGRELGRATINSINGITQQTGKMQLVLV